MGTLEPILEKLAKSQTAFFRAADTVPSNQWKIRPTIDAWSAGELVAHLVMVERAVVGGADRISQKSPKQIPYLKRLHLPLWLVESRIIRRKTPIPLDQSLIADKEAMMADLRAARERTLSFLTETSDRDLSVYR